MELEKEKIFPNIFRQTQEVYQEMMENREKRKMIISFLNYSEQTKRTLSCWGRIRWEKIGTGEWKVGKEWENVLAEILAAKKFFGENAKIWLSDPRDDQNGVDLIIYLGEEKDILLAIDLTLNSKETVLEEKFECFKNSNPVPLEIPPEIRKNNPEALRFVLTLPKIAGLETINRFFHYLSHTTRVEELKKDESFQKDELINAILYEFLEQMNLQLEKFSQTGRATFLPYSRIISNLREFFSKQLEGLKKESTPTSEEIKNFLAQTFLGKKTREIIKKI
ncbi:MAG: hypothetical protein N2259_00655 [Patescibacteria group bacterium]|nr:hypothetical protein [Patescibacteria group bacterium]